MIINSIIDLGEEFIEPTKIYVNAIKAIIKTGCVKAVAHITGGGLIENIPRVLPNDVAVILNADKFRIPPIFGWVAESANLPCFEMLRTFNCGLGMVIVVSKENIENTIASLVGHESYIIGEVIDTYLIILVYKYFFFG